MSESKDMRQKWNDFRPTKTMWFWSSAGAVAVALILGFTVGGWVTGGTASEMAEAAHKDGKAELAAAICVDRFLESPQYAANLAALKEESSWAQDRFLSQAGWATLAGMEDPVAGAAEICAETLVEMDGTTGETAADTTKS